MPISGSVGAATIDGAATSGHDLVRFADAAMFEAKHHGPGHRALADTSLITSVEGQVDGEGQLREALVPDGLTLQYQPVVDAADRVTMAEALVRWPHPEHGMLSPDVLLPIAERGGLMCALDRWVLRTALTEATRWPHSQGHPVSVAVNLAGLLPDGAEAVHEITTILAETGIDPTRAVLEITETTLVDVPERTRAAMRELAEHGVRFAIDDFGTGYSSLARLKDLPVHILKLDRTLIPQHPGDVTNRAITQAVVDISHTTGHRCLAEGVETTTQLQLLQTIGLDAYQGWPFSHPVTAANLHRLLNNTAPQNSKP